MTSLIGHGSWIFTSYLCHMPIVINYLFACKNFYLGVKSYFLITSLNNLMINCHYGFVTFHFYDVSVMLCQEYPTKYV